MGGQTRMDGVSETSRILRASCEDVYRAFIDPESIAVWLAPGDMSARVLEFDGRVGGGYRMSLTYPESMPGTHGKSTAREDRYSARFVELSPPSRIVEAIRFDSADPAFIGEMTMIVGLEPVSEGTRVTIRFENLPPGVRPEDNDAGTRSSLEKLAQLVESPNL